MNMTIKGTLAHVIQRYGLNSFQAHLLGELNSEDGQPIRQLANQICVKPSNFTPLLHSLEEAGLIERRQDENDKRSYRIYLTKKGREKSKSIDEDFALLFGGESPQAKELQNQVLAGFEAFRKLAEISDSTKPDSHSARQSEGKGKA